MVTAQDLARLDTHEDKRVKRLESGLKGIEDALKNLATHLTDIGLTLGEIEKSLEKDEPTQYPWLSCVEGEFQELDDD